MGCRYLLTGLGASLLPDLDLIYFYLIDHRRHPHHTYISHIPIYWILGALCIVSCCALRRHRCMMWSTIIISNVLLHLILDSLASKVLWLYPISDSGVGLFHVPSQHEWWVWNYLFHWTFGFEILIVVAAACLLYYKRNSEASYRMQKGKRPLCG